MPAGFRARGSSRAALDEIAARTQQRKTMFAKIFASIFDSSIAEDWQTRVVFQDMLVLADKDGIVDMTPSSIARRTNILLEMVQAAIPKLERPDTSSRTPDHDGRRITRLDAHRECGWQIVNFNKYRESATKEMLRMGDADRKRAWRARYGKSSSPTPPTPNFQMQKQREKQTSPGLVRDMSETTTPLGALASLEDWQLQKELKCVKEDLKAARMGQQQDPALIKGMLNRKQSIEDEKRRRYSTQSAEQLKTETPPTKRASGEPLRRMTPEERATLWNQAKAKDGIKA